MPLYVRKQIYIFVAPDTPSIFDFLCPEKDFISIINITFTYNLGRLQLGSNIIAACGISGPSRNNSKLRLHDADAVAKCSRYLYVALHTKKKRKKMPKGRGGNLFIHL